MKQRCLNPKHPRYARYGGRGIKVSKRWLSFTNFFIDMGPRPTGRTLDRIDVHGNYSRRNCRWATAKQQAGNKAKKVKV